MGKSMYEIKMDFDKALQQAGELLEAADSLENLLGGSYTACLQGISVSWKGENARAFIQKGNVIGENVKGTVLNLRKAAIAIRTIAKNTYNAERQNFELAQARSYGGGGMGGR